MQFLYPFLIVLHVFLCFFLILLVLIQNDKGGGLAGALGGMQGGALTGSSAANLITRITQSVAIVSFVVILLLNALSSKRVQVRQSDSELKATSKTLSSVLPQGYGMETPGGGSGLIPGIGADEGPGMDGEKSPGMGGNEFPGIGGEETPASENP